MPILYYNNSQRFEEREGCLRCAQQGCKNSFFKKRMCECEHPINANLRTFKLSPLYLFSHFGFGSDDWYRHWLHIPREDGKPRVLLVTKVKTFENGISPLLTFIEKIKQV
jgi:hypothetical protein